MSDYLKRKMAELESLKGQWIKFDDRGAAGLRFNGEPVHLSWHPTGSSNGILYVQVSDIGLDPESFIVKLTHSRIIQRSPNFAGNFYSYARNEGEIFVQWSFKYKIIKNIKTMERRIIKENFSK